MKAAYPTFDFDHTPEDVVYFDVETQSAADLRLVGGRNYAADPTTRPLVTAFLTGDRVVVWGPRYLWPDGNVPPLSIQAMTPAGYGPVPPISLHVGDDPPPLDLDKVFVAHNLADFDYHIARRFWPRLPQRWYDTLPAARAAGYPGALDDLASRLVGMEQTETEAINAQVKELTGAELENTRSPKKVGAWLASRGVRLPSLRKLLEQFLADPEADLEGVEILFEGGLPEPVVQVIQARLLTSRIAGPKLARAVRSVGADQRLRDLLVYHQAGTGRWAGRGFQVHNLPKPRVKKFPTEELFALYRADNLTPDAIRATGLSVPDAIGGLTRGCLLPSPGCSFLVADYAAVEARGVAWLADEQRLLEKFNADEDVYLDLAATLFGRPCTKADDKERGVGKIGILDCGYGMSSAKLAMNCALDGVDLKSAGTTAEAVVDAYRSSYPAIAGHPSGVIQDTGQVYRRDGLWQRLAAVAMSAAQTGRVEQVGRCVFRMHGADLLVELPSGRELVYRSARVEERVPGYCVLLGLPAKPKATLVYESTRGETTMYGGKWAENLTQAVCRDFLATAVLLSEIAGLNPILHVHDEIVCEASTATAEDDLRRLAILMSTPPPWAAGFPVKVEGFTTPRYGKSPWKGSLVVEAVNGCIVKEKRA